jgi:hypothetical protein
MAFTLVSDDYYGSIIYGKWNTSESPKKRRRKEEKKEEHVT